MTTINRLLAVTALAASTVAFSGCSAQEHTDREIFPYQGSELVITNSNSNMPVSVKGGANRQVEVSVTTTALGKSANRPAWTLHGDDLNLDSPCTKGYVGLCEGRYAVIVPAGTAVTVNGKKVTVR